MASGAEGKNRQWLLATRPTGMIEDGNFSWVEGPVPTLDKDGQVLVRNLYLSVDPTQRGWLSRDTYVPAVRIGEVVRAFGAGRVVESRSPRFAVGDVVQGLFGWQDYAVADTAMPGAVSKLPGGVPVPLALSALGLTGLTAYFGLLDLGKPQAGETVVVSGAAGATGSAAGQIAKIQGCRAIGIAGGPEKCAWVVQELGLDACIDYKSENVQARLGELCPKGIDVYFDNVGGEILDAALARLAFHGRVVLCGAISQYNETEAPTGPRHYINLVIRRGRMEGFIVTDFAARFAEGAAALAGWVASGKLKDRIDLAHGLENAPATLRRLFRGENTGKQLLQIAE
jgi:NADPH-dependent curcumin reductase CurA